MTEAVIIRQYEKKDIPVLTDIWQEAFGDKAELIEKFYTLLPGMGKGFVAEVCGNVVGMLHILDAELENKSIGYVYAVAVKKEYRKLGIGRSLCQAAAGMDKDIIATLPSEKSLYAWYEKVLGTKPVLYGKYERVFPCKGNEFRKIGVEEYCVIRSELLRNKTHIDFPGNYIKFQEELCRIYGGGMYAGNGGIACGYPDDNMLYIKEALGNVSFIPAVCASLGASCAVIRTASVRGEPFIAAQGDFPSECEWNLVLD